MFNTERMNELMEKRGMDPGKLEYLASISRSQVWYLQHSKKPGVSAVIVGKVAQVLGCSVDYLLNLTDDPTPVDRRAMPAGFVELWEVFHQMPSELQGRFTLIARVMAGDLWGVSETAAVQIIEDHAARLIARDGDGAADELLAALAEALASKDPVAIQRLLIRIIGDDQTE